MVDVDKAVRKALAEGKTEISGISAATVRKSLRLHASGLKTELVLMLTGFKKTPEL